MQVYLYFGSLFCSVVLTPQHYHWYAATRFAFQWTTAVNELDRPVSTSSVISACWQADALRCENKRCSDSNPSPMNPKANVLPITPQRLNIIAVLSLGLEGNLTTPSYKRLDSSYPRWTVASKEHHTTPNTPHHTTRCDITLTTGSRYMVGLRRIANRGAVRYG